VHELYDADAHKQGGIEAEDRYDVMRLHPCTTLSIEAVEVTPGLLCCSQDVGNAAAAVKLTGQASPVMPVAARHRRRRHGAAARSRLAVTGKQGAMPRYRDASLEDWTSAAAAGHSLSAWS
jgi:hypothetical protein